MRSAPEPARAYGVVVGQVLALALALLSGSGCTVGSGTGSAVGDIWLLGCDSEHDIGSAAQPQAYSLQPSFFAGEPVEDISQGAHTNRLVIRMQRKGGAIETDDVVFFDVQNSYEVARCVRGRVWDTGEPDWNTNYRSTGPWCDWSGAAVVDGGLSVDAAIPQDAGAPGGGVVTSVSHPIIRLTTAGVMRASVWLLSTCPLARLSADAVEGWIQFLDFGSAAQSDVPPQQRSQVDPDFKVNFGERLRANFVMLLGDHQVVTAQLTNAPSIPDPRIGGDLSGSFDFDFERGRAAQPFP